MRPRIADDTGSAIVEFVVLGIGLLVPLVFAVQSVMALHAAALATGHSVREAARAFGSSATVTEGRHRADVAARLAFADHGLDLPPGTMRIACADGPCLSPGSAVVVTLQWDVPLPWLGWAVPVAAEQRVPIDDYRGDAQP
ncbi:MAG: pilus assembly protein [Actinomycetota bacterium]|nr:pilus assembly protein [Actinomycetota bacterium]